MTATCDIAVIGAGPAGMAAATVAAEGGATVTVFDEQPGPGGQIYRSVEQTQGSAELRRILGPDYAYGAALVERFRASGAGYASGSSVWQITPEREVWATRGGALGGHAGWRGDSGDGCDGAAGAGARLDAARRDDGGRGADPAEVVWADCNRRTCPGRLRAVALPARVAAAAAGQPPSAILDTATRADEFRALRHLPAAMRRPLSAPRAEGLFYLRKGLSLRLALRRARLRMFRYVTDLWIEGGTCVEAVSFCSGGAIYRVPAQLVALHEGVIPAQQATRSLGCDHEWDPVQHCFRPVLDRWGNTSVKGVLVAGDAGGIGGARAAEHAGRIAAWEALRQIGRIDEFQRIRNAAPDVAGRASHLAIRPLLDALYPPPATILRPADDVIICRCEEITAGQVRDVARRGCQGPNQAKSFLRAGMGPCQGRMCGNAVSELIAAERGVSVDDVGYFRIRPPLKPVTLGELAAMDVAD